MQENDVIVLGGGMAGLAAAYYLRKKGAGAVVVEENPSIGGNCRTFERGGFYFDSGAHRFHDRNEEVTREIIELMGNRIRKIYAPSMIFDSNNFLNFPIQLSDILGKMPPFLTARAGLSLVYERLFRKNKGSFYDFAVKSYGRVMAERYLLNYSEKLWGRECKMLSPAIAGKRLKGINLLTVLKSFFSEKSARRSHFEGDFYYPEGGIKRISEKLAASIGPENIRLNCRVTSVAHSGSRITGVQINGRENLSGSCFVSTLPVSGLIGMLEPRPPGDVMSAAAGLYFRNIRLAAFAVKTDSINNCATMYFPDRKYPFTRVYEPKNRHEKMSPKGSTMLVAEVPCFDGDKYWVREDAEFLVEIRKILVGTGIAREKDITASYSERMKDAYPVLEKGYEEKTKFVLAYLKNFENIYLSGRNGLFKYSWIHDMFETGRLIAESILSKRQRTGK